MPSRKKHASELPISVIDPSVFLQPHMNESRWHRNTYNEQLYTQRRSSQDSIGGDDDEYMPLSEHVDEKPNIGYIKTLPFFQSTYSIRDQKSHEEEESGDVFKSPFFQRTQRTPTNKQKLLLNSPFFSKSSVSPRHSPTIRGRTERQQDNGDKKSPSPDVTYRRDKRSPIPNKIASKAKRRKTVKVNGDIKSISIMPSDSDSYNSDVEEK